MIAQEGYWAIGFGVFMLIDLIMAFGKRQTPRAVRIIGAVCAAVLVVVTGFAYIGFYGVPAWTTFATPALFIASDAAMGVALWGIFRSDLYRNRTFVLVSVVVYALLAAALLYGAWVFSAVGLSPMPFVVGLLVASVGGIVFVYTGAAGKMKANTAAILCLICAAVGVLIARYAFYAAAGMM